MQIKTIEISSCLKMGISLFFFFLFMRLFAEINGRSRNDECKASRCSDYDGPVIRFPFRLKHQPEHCGYPEFELSCSEEKRTILELPSSGKLWVKEINYTSQEIVLWYPRDYLQWQILNFNLSAFPFQFKDEYTYSNFSFFNCSEDITNQLSYADNQLWSIPYSILSSNPVYVAPSSYSLAEVNLSSCQKIFNATLPDNYMFDHEREFYMYGGEYGTFMNWSKPMCGNCEAKGNKCQRKKNNSTEPEIECIDKPAKGTKSRFIIFTLQALSYLLL